MSNPPQHRGYDPDETAMLPRVTDEEPPPASVDDAPTTVFTAIPAAPQHAPSTPREPAGDAGGRTPPPLGDTPTTVIPAVTAQPEPAQPELAPPSVPQSAAAGTVANADGDRATRPKAAVPVPPLEDRHTTVLPAVRDGVPPGDKRKAAPRRRWNEKVVPLRARRTAAGYRSVYSDLTRTTTRTRLRTAARGVGEVLVTLGAVALLFFVYEVWGTTAAISAQQDRMEQQLLQEWEATTDPTVAAPSTPPSATAPAPPPANISGVAILHIPRLEKRWVVVEGVRQQDIVRNPGHYPGTAMPGEEGNFAIAGHRNRGTFWYLDRMQPGDKIVVQTKDSWYIYEVTTQRIVLPTAIEVVRPVPPGQQPGKLLTITTCHPLLDNYERLIVHAKLVREQPTSAGQPAELKG